MTHHLKSWVEFYCRIKFGELTSNIRKDDREPKFQDGDDIIFEEYDPVLKQYTGHTCRCKLLSVQRNVVGLRADYCVMSIKVCLDGCRFISERAGLAG